MSDSTLSVSHGPTSIHGLPELTSLDVSAIAADNKADLILTDGSLTPTDSSFAPSPTGREQTTATRRLSTLSSVFDRRSEQAWTPSVLSIRPLLGLLALVVSIACMLVSLAILLASNDQPVSKWTIQPTVYLAIASALANTALAFARYHAIPLAVSKGNSIRDLERQWEAGHSVVLALRHNVRMGFSGFATLLVAIMIIDGTNHHLSMPSALSKQVYRAPAPTGYFSPIRNRDNEHYHCFAAGTGITL
ncbi:hypothetical protein LTS10_012589 [Elasticomyces elasticus]|nr:hypothetical protein LTS10_012589 [Elasticomyces elasticus]